MKLRIGFLLVFVTFSALAAEPKATNRVASDTNHVTNLGKIVVEGAAISKYRSEKVSSTALFDVPPEEFPGTVDVLTKDFIREQNPHDIHDLLHYEPGVFNGGRTLMAVNAGSYNIRGLEGGEILIDGTLPAAGAAMSMFMNPSSIDRIEIAKGPVGGAQGGITGSSGGAGGSVNLMLKHPSLDSGFAEIAARAAIGRSFQRGSLSYDINAPMMTNRVAIRIPGMASILHPYYAPSGARLGENYSFSPSLLIAVNDGLRLGVNTTFQYSDQPGYQGVPIYQGMIYGAYSRYSNPALRRMRDVYQGFTVQPYLEWEPSDWITLKTGVGIAHSDIEYEHLGPGSFFNTATQTFKPQGYEHQAGDYIADTYSAYQRATFTNDVGPVNFQTVLQADYQRRMNRGRAISPASTATSDPNPPEPSGSQWTLSSTDVQRYGVLAQEYVNWSIIRLFAGAKQDYHVSNLGNHGYSLSPRGGVSIIPLKWLVLFGNISITESPNFGKLKAAGAELTSSWKALQYESGIRVSPFDDFWLSASAFRIKQDHLPSLEPSSVYYTEEGENESRGVELSASGNLTENWTVYASYTFIRYEDKALSKRFDRYPPHSLILATSYRFESGWLEDIVIGCSYRFRDKYSATMRGNFIRDDFFIKESHVFDLSVDIPLSKFGGPKNMALSFACKNIFDRFYIESNRHYYQCFPGDPRTFEIGLRASF